jgi:hypothetical protein
MAAVIAVSMNPGATAFTVMFHFRSARACAWTSPITPALLVA